MSLDGSANSQKYIKLIKYTYGSTNLIKLCVFVGCIDESKETDILWHAFESDLC